MPTTVVSWSRIRSWRRCHRLHHYKYNEGLQRKRRPVPLLRGVILHELLDARANKKDPGEVLRKYAKEYKRLFDEEKELYGDVIEDCRKIFFGYCKLYEKDGLEVVASEHRVSVELGDDLMFKGYIDKVVRDRRKQLWIMDHKSHKNLPSEESRFSDLQLVFYIWAWNHENPKKPITGVIWDYLRTKVPTVPEVLKSGQLSMRENIDTTYDVYLEAVRENTKLTGEDPMKYNPILEKLKTKPNNFYRRVQLPTPPRVMIEQVVREMTETAAEVRERGTKSSVRTMVRECVSCEFYNLCHAELRGLDSDFIRKAEYEQRKDQDYADEEDNE